MSHAATPARYQITLDPQADGCRWQVSSDRVRATGAAPNARLANAEGAMVVQMFGILDRASRRRF